MNANRHPTSRRSTSRRRGVDVRSTARRGVASLETLIIVGVTLPIAVGMFFTARAACGRLFHIIQMLVAWPHL